MITVSLWWVSTVASANSNDTNHNDNASIYSEPMVMWLTDYLLFLSVKVMSSVLVWNCLRLFICLALFAFVFLCACVCLQLFVCGVCLCLCLWLTSTAPFHALRINKRDTTTTSHSNFFNILFKFPWNTVNGRRHWEQTAHRWPFIRVAFQITQALSLSPAFRKWNIREAYLDDACCQEEGFRRKNAHSSTVFDSVHRSRQFSRHIFSARLAANGKSVQTSNSA